MTWGLYFSQNNAHFTLKLFFAIFEIIEKDTSKTLDHNQAVKIRFDQFAVKMPILNCFDLLEINWRCFIQFDNELQLSKQFHLLGDVVTEKKKG